MVFILVAKKILHLKKNGMSTTSHISSEDFTDSWAWHVLHSQVSKHCGMILLPVTEHTLWTAEPPSGPFMNNPDHENVLSPHTRLCGCPPSSLLTTGLWLVWSKTALNTSSLTITKQRRRLKHQREGYAPPLPSIKQWQRESTAPGSSGFISEKTWTNHTNTLTKIVTLQILLWRASSATATSTRAPLTLFCKLFIQHYIRPQNIYLYEHLSTA